MARVPKNYNRNKRIAEARAARDGKHGNYVPIEERFWAKVQKTDTCWLWLGSKSNGYGRVSVNRVSRPAHRIAYILTHGHWPEGLEAHHVCHVKACVRPHEDHVVPVTRAENIEAEYRSRR